MHTLTHMCMCTHTCTHTHSLICMYATHTHVHTHLHVHTHSYVCSHAHTYTHTCTHTDMYAHTHTHTHTQVETFGSMERDEKVRFILEQMRLCLAKRDYVRTQIISKKISTKFFFNESDLVQVGKEEYTHL